MNQQSHTWTPERTARLVLLWADESLSARDIGRELGITRRAVLAKRMRMNLPKRDPRVLQPPPKPDLKEPYTPVLGYEPDTSEQFEPIPALDVTEGEVKDGCQWLHRDPKERNFCNRVKKTGSSYCEHHMRLAYQPKKQRNRSA